MTSTPGEAFGLAAGPAEFDVDAWISSAARPQRTVDVYGRADLLARLDAIAAEVAAIRRRVAMLGDDPERSISDAPEGVEALADLEAEWDDLAAQFTASRMPVVVRGLTEAEEAAALKGAQKARPDLAKAQNAEWQEFVGLRIVAAAVVSPALTFDQIAAIHSRIGGAAFAPLANTVRALTRQAPVVPPTPFSKTSSPPART